MLPLRLADEDQFEQLAAGGIDLGIATSMEAEVESLSEAAAALHSCLVCGDVFFDDHCRVRR